MFNFYDEFQNSVNSTDDIPNGIYSEFLHRFETRGGDQLIISKYVVNEIPTVIEMVFIASNDDVLMKEMIFIDCQWRDDQGNFYKNIVEALPVSAINLMLIDESTGATFAKE